MELPFRFWILRSALEGFLNTVTRKCLGLGYELEADDACDDENNTE